jgi:hypothetical protein
LNAASQTIQEVEYDYTGPEGISSLAGFGASGFCIGWTWKNGDVLFVDDEGLLKPYQYGFRMRARADGQPYPGNGFVTGRDSLHDDGTDPPLKSMADIAMEIEWLDRAAIVKWLKERAGTPFGTITSRDGSTPFGDWAEFLQEREQ